MEKKVFEVENIDSPLRIDRYLSFIFKNYSREYIKNLCKNKYIKLNNCYVKPNKKVFVGDKIEIIFPERKDFITLGNPVGFKTLYEDDEILVIDKPAFLKVHPVSKFDKEMTLIDFLTEKFKNIKFENWYLNRPFLVHRLDKETSGVMVIAKTPTMQFNLSKQFQKRQIKKIYRAIVSGKVNFEKGNIIAPIKKEKNISKIDFLGKDAKTEFKVLSKNEKFSYLEIYPKTGRSHQIRAHLNFIGHPIIGDIKYKGVSEIYDKKIPRFMLHSYSIEFFDYRSKKWLKFFVEPPQDFKFFLSFLSL